MAPALACRGVDAGYGGAPVLRGIDLELGPDELVAVLGPSGSGKSTLIGCVAGFVDPSAGEIEVAGQLVVSARTSLPSEARDVAVVFQHYALWPHLTAIETVAYPLRRAGLDHGTARRRAAELLERLGLAPLAERRPGALSGGEQQRVGLARALARAPSLLLMDEPTSHLDAELRETVQAELAARRREAGAAALYATHDAAEALAVADRVVLLRAGEIIQIGTPREVYEEPTSVWNARLTGPASVLHVSIEDATSATPALTLAGMRCRVSLGHLRGLPTGARDVLVRPDWACLGGPLPGRITQVAFRGPHTDYRLDTPGGELTIRQPGSPTAAPREPTGWTLRRAWPLAASVGA